MPFSVPILMYHAIADASCEREARYTTTPAAFEAHMHSLVAGGYTTLSLSDLHGLWLRGATPPSRAVVITFDDGFACLHETAAPILARLGLRASVFAISGYLDRMGRYDADLGIPARPMLARSQLQELHESGIEIGSHSVNHPDLRSLSLAGLRYELERSRGDLEDLISAPVLGFSYPRGLFDRAVHDAVREAGYLWGCSTRPGLNNRQTGHFTLRRAQVGRQTDQSAFAKLLRQGAAPGTLASARLREKLVELVATLGGRDPMDLYTRPLRHSVAARWLNRA
jgi:peptidoglycan/xylan/chitin deacetylase (PgdA/CDA1 family)